MKTATKTLGILAVLSTLSLLTSGCANSTWDSPGTAGDGGGGSSGSGIGGKDSDPDPGDDLCGPLTDKPLDSLVACCSTYGGAHCVDEVPVDFESLVAPCDGGGYCVPDDFILLGGAVQPEKCTSIGDAEGRWMSACIPEVEKNSALLPEKEGDPGMFCVPCINPLDKTETGVCTIGTTCGGGPVDSVDPDPGGGATCDDPGAPIDPSIFAACPNQCGGRCVDKAFLPDPNDPAIAQLGECEPGSGQLCVPDELIASQGLAVPDTCDWYGLEGRCMSECIPQIAEQVASGFLTQSSCSENHWCAPCFDPITDEPTGACTLTCDAGPDPAKPHDLPTCCEGIGTCVPGPLAGDQADSLGEDVCPEDSGLLCAPNDLMPGSGYVPQPCTPEFNIVEVDPDHKYGVCLPGCLPDLDSFFLNDTGECGDKYKCAPCWQPGFGADSKSDAPGCEY
jgi:hypothetical protein